MQPEQPRTLYENEMGNQSIGASQIGLFERKARRMMKKQLTLLAAGLLALSLFTACGTDTQNKVKDNSTTTKQEKAGDTGEKDKTDKTEEAKETEETSKEKPVVEITVKDYGTITVELDREHAPATVDNFLKLTEEGFYDGLTFHRIIEGFMIQGGDPLGNGTGGSDETIPGEFSENGVENPLSHTRGAISMARSQDYDSASSQFFIVQEDSTYLDGQYAAFGYVTEGMEVVDKICSQAAVQDQNGTVLAEDQPAIESIKLVEQQ